MKVSGFSFIRNAIKFDFPIIEAIQSILPICDEFVIAVGASDDETKALIQNVNEPKIRIIDTVWDDSLRSGGKVLAVETDKAFKAIADDSDWAFYIQGDEVIHERYLGIIKNAMIEHAKNPNVDGLLFNYLHFYGSYDFVGSSPKWYRKEIRVVKNDPAIFSYRDAQGFRKEGNVKLSVKPINAFVYHYGWVKPPQTMKSKMKEAGKFWNNDDTIKERIVAANKFDYSEIDSLKHFDGTHPSMMQERIQNQNWSFDFDISMNKMTVKNKLRHWINRKTGWLPGEYKNYKMV